MFISMPYTFICLNRFRTQRETTMFIILNGPPEPPLLSPGCNPAFLKFCSLWPRALLGLGVSFSRPLCSATLPGLPLTTLPCLQCVSQAHAFLFHSLVSDW